MKGAKITQRQIDIVFLMQNGYLMFVGQSETNGSIYYLVSKGYHNEYFNASTLVGSLKMTLFTNSFRIRLIMF